MEELQTRELEVLVQEMEEEGGVEEELPPEVEALLRDLQPARLFSSRRRAARQLGEVSRSSRQIVQALMTVAEFDSSTEVRAMPYVLISTWSLPGAWSARSSTLFEN